MLTAAALELVIRALIEHGPEAAAAIRAFLSKPEPTDEDWEELFRRYKKPYDDYIRGRNR